MKSYVIRWRNKENGRIGKGSRLFEKEEAEKLVAELNAEYPEIEHDLLDANLNQLGQPTERGAETKDGEPQHSLTE